MRAALPIALAVLGNLLYHSSQKMTPAQVNPFLTVSVSFGLASLLAFGAFLATKAGPVGVEASRLSWTAVGLGLAVVVIETSFLLAYRAGWPVGYTSLVVTIGQTAMLIPLGILAFGERLTVGGLAGALIGLAGLAIVVFQSAPR